MSEKPPPSPYGYHWRTVVRPKILERAGGKCERCHRAGLRLDVAHLDRKPRHDDENNLAALCRRCHRKHDYKQWARKCFSTRARRKDQARPLLEQLNKLDARMEALAAVLWGRTSDRSKRR